MAIITVSDATFENEVLKAQGPVLVDFWAAWCGPCRMVAPVVESIAAETVGELKVAKLNVDENPGTAATYGIMSIPTLMVFKNGEIVEKLIGFMPKDAMLKVLDKYIG